MCVQWYCPYSWETEEELGVCVHVNFQVLAQADNAMVSVAGAGPGMMGAREARKLHAEGREKVGCNHWAALSNVLVCVYSSAVVTNTL